LQVWFSFSPGHRQDRFSRHRRARRRRATDVRCSGRARSSRTAPAIATRGNDGSTALAFGARTTQPTIEDVGEARLANGSAYVPLHRAFAATVDPNAPYLAFVTAEGDTRGLYVAQLDARIFPLHRTDLKPLAPPARPAMLR
jgi:hypothetical protein